MSNFACDFLRLDGEREINRIVDRMRTVLKNVLKRRGVVVGLSGGIDSSVVAALACEALGPSRVFGLLMPEGESDGSSLRLGEQLARELGIEYRIEDITAPLEALGCYRRRDAAICKVAPQFGEGWKSKLAIRKVQEGGFHFFSLVLMDPNGETSEVTLTQSAYAEIVAASNFKQRVRKMIEYYHADRLHYAVCGTPNRLEYDQGFFVKQGDGAADLKPIAHLYKTQVYQLAEALNIPEEIRTRPPTTDTFSFPQSQEEFFFSVPLKTLDICLFGLEHGLPPETVAEASQLTPDEVRQVYSDISIKRRSTRYLHLHPVLIEETPLL